ncbi:MAG: ABC transporter ATP-binding protein, partial [Tardiphaga sp.]|nr:ABC transporter ATP-binding protein [Tardiphaga sp.]
EYPGAVIMVSHDRYLIEACADQLWIVADKTVTNFDGDLNDYRRIVMQQRGMRASSRDRAATAEKGNGKEKGAPKIKEKKLPLKQRVAEAETEMARITGILAKIDLALATPGLFKKDPKQAAQLSKARSGAAAALARAEETWLAVSTQYENS